GLVPAAAASPQRALAFPGARGGTGAGATGGTRLWPITVTTPSRTSRRPQWPARTARRSSSPAAPGWSTSSRLPTTRRPAPVQQRPRDVGDGQPGRPEGLRRQPGRQFLGRPVHRDAGLRRGYRRCLVDPVRQGHGRRPTRISGIRNIAVSPDSSAVFITGMIPGSARGPAATTTGYATATE